MLKTKGRIRSVGYFSVKFDPVRRAACMFGLSSLLEGNLVGDKGRNTKDSEELSLYVLVIFEICGG